jgi:predicted RNA-binding Zn-ribbon protein involved in translation (DUF1610 family)
MSNAVKILLAGGILVLAAVLYFARGGATESVGDRTSYDAVLECAACNHRYNARVESGAEFPLVCPACAKPEVWKVMYCRQCKALFLPPVSGDPPRPPMIAKCPQCGSTSTGAAPVTK